MVIITMFKVFTENSHQTGCVFWYDERNVCRVPGKNGVSIYRLYFRNYIILIRLSEQEIDIIIRILSHRIAVQVPTS